MAKKNVYRRLNLLRRSTFVLLFVCVYASANSQSSELKWYSASTYQDVIIQNSFPKGGPYLGKTKKNHYHSYLVFFSRLVNGSNETKEVFIHFSENPIPIPGSPDTYMQLILPSDTMTLDKVGLFSYGITELQILDPETCYSRILKPQEECFVYIVALYYQAKESAWQQKRGGNRGELILEGEDLYYRMLPQVEALPCGKIYKVKR